MPLPSCAGYSAYAANGQAAARACNKAKAHRQITADVTFVVFDMLESDRNLKPEYLRIVARTFISDLP